LLKLPERGKKKKSYSSIIHLLTFTGRCQVLIAFKSKNETTTLISIPNFFAIILSQIIYLLKRLFSNELQCLKGLSFESLVSGAKPS